jgi:hypothetical protein
MNDEFNIEQLNNYKQQIINKDIVKTQHYSKNIEFIHNFDISIFNNQIIIEPFYGNGDLIKLILGNNDDNNNIKPLNIIKYDIDIKDKNTDIIYKDTLLNNILKHDSYIITNPPYLAKNKLNEDMKKMYKDLLIDCNDLYQIFIKQLIKIKVLGGILILPVNFMIGKQTEHLRNQFKNMYNILHLNIFEKQMFENTT